MDVQSTSVEELYSYQSVPIRLELHTACKAPDIYGNFYTVEPETKNIVIVQFKVENKSVPSNLLIVPSESIKLFHELGDDEIPEDAPAVPSDESIIEAIDNFLKPKEEEKESDEVISARKQKLIDHLTKQNVPITVDEHFIQIGPVRLVHPFKPNNLISENVVAVQRTKTMLTTILQ